MKPIHPNDRQKVIVLGALSVIMLGFFTTRLMAAMTTKGNPKTARLVIPDAPGASQPVQPAPSSVAPGAGTAPPTTVAATTAAPGATSLPMTPADRIADFGGPADPFRRVLPDLAKLTAGTPPPPLRILSASPSPLRGRLGGVGPAGIGGALAVAPMEPKFRLDGVMLNQNRYVMITIDDRTDMYQVGARVAGAYVLVKITESDATFRGKHGTFKLAVGAEHEPDMVANPGGGSRLMNRGSAEELAESGGLPLPSPDGS